MSLLTYVPGKQEYWWHQYEDSASYTQKGQHKPTNLQRCIMICISPRHLLFIHDLQHIKVLHKGVQLQILVHCSLRTIPVRIYTSYITLCTLLLTVSVLVTVTRPTRLGKSSGSTVYTAVMAIEDPTPSVILNRTANVINTHPPDIYCKNLKVCVSVILC